MRTSKSSSPGNRDRNVKAVRALLEAEDMPPGSALVEALKKEINFGTPLILTTISFPANSGDQTKVADVRC